MTRGEGSLFLATRTGIAVASEPVRAAGPPAPTWWAHHCAVAWTAAWVKLRGHELLGARELLEGDEWSRDISWRDRSGFKNATHRPDLIVFRRGGGRFAIEVELTKKSGERLRAILMRHAVSRSSGQTGGVIYVCADEDGCKRIAKHGADVGIAKGRGLRVELLATIKDQALAGHEEIRAARCAGDPYLRVQSSPSMAAETPQRNSVELTESWFPREAGRVTGDGPMPASTPKREGPSAPDSLPA